MHKAWWLGGVGLLVVAAALGAAKVSGVAFGAKDAPKVEPTLEFTPREVVQPTLASLPLQLEFSGALVAPQSAVVRAKAAGTLLSLVVGEGSRVRAGQPLGQIDLSDIGSRVAERQAAVESARAQFVQAQRTHASNQGLADQKFISPNALDSSRTALDAARAGLDAAQAQLSTARLGLREAALVAPIAGLVSKRHVLPGEKLAMEQPVLTLVDLATLELAGSVGTHEVALLAPGMPVQLRIEGLEQPVTGRIERIAPAAEPGTRSIGVTVSVANPKERLRAGQYAVAQVTLADTAQRLTVPLAAVGGQAGQPQVWVIDNGVLARRAITIGRRDEALGRVEVVSGLATGVQVLAARFDNLREGAKAVVVARASAVASAAASSNLR
ncbi:efflux RND transporter periplasmic adaptor subunit [Rhizobacter sp. AJA081-3]|uniref:efflux RND transporter periplasmic adaptor subunit n=1 Tax=Rhizobacter sp. AJA081-3 TaxID=2753607 RepID=UPI001ADF9331|nr:efflux RND transporter periplasmic adaptor subunit [Rhizobacter sp. AJA081-3]QTN24970.1 efflux RND transporter periplasmic adaptor subunit [Rhizobacter sp. AJA081-3]